MNQYLKKRCALILVAVIMAVSTVNPVMAAGTTVMELESASGTEYEAVQDQEIDGKSEEESNAISELETDMEADVEVSTEINTENSLEEITTQGKLGLETFVEPETNMEPIAADAENLLMEEIPDEESTVDRYKAIISEEEAVDQENTLEVNGELAKNGDVKDVGTLKVDKEFNGTLNGDEEVRYSFKPTATGYYQFKIQADQNLYVSIKEDGAWGTIKATYDTTNICIQPDKLLLKNTSYSIAINTYWNADKTKPNPYKIKVTNVTKTIKENEKAVWVTEKAGATVGYCFTPKSTKSYDIVLIESDKNVRGITSIYDEKGDSVSHELTKGKKYYFKVQPYDSENFKEMKYKLHIAPEKENKTFRYVIHEKKVTILRCLEYSEKIKIPDKIDGNEVVAIEGFVGCHELETIIIPDSVKRIGNSAFSGCSALKTIKLPKKLEEIEGFAFGNCTSLETVTIPDNVKQIGYSAFEGCSALKKIALPKKVEEIGSGAFSGCTSLESVTLDTKVEVLSREVFENCSRLKKITLPRKLKIMEKYSFYNCKELEQIKIPNTVTEIGESAFGKCNKLKNVTLPGSLLQLGYRAFEDCSSLEQMKLPAKVSFDSNPFGNCVKLKSVSVDSANPYIINKENMLYGKTSANNDRLKLLTCLASKTGTARIISGTTAMGADCFAGCSKITEVILEADVSSGHSEYKNCLNLKKFTVDEGNRTYKSIDGVLYYKSKTLRLLCCPPAAESVKIEEGVEYIDQSIFKKCSKLKEVTIPSTVTKFECASGGIFSDCTALTKIDVNPDNQIFKSVDGAVYSKDGRILCIVPGGKKGEFKVPDGVTQMGGHLSEREAYIYRTFENCAGITKIKIPASVQSIDARSFIGCTKLESIEVDSKNKAYYSKSGVLYDSKKKTLLCCPSNIKSLSILSTVTTIAYNAFYRTNLKKVNLPSSVEAFEKQSVVLCDFGLYFTSSKVADFKRSWVEIYDKDKDGNSIRIIPTGYYYSSITAWKETIDKYSEFAGIPWKEIESSKATLSQPKLKKAASSEKGKIKITWSKVSGATGYIVYKKSGKEWKKLATVKSPTVSYTDKGLTSGKKYAYTVAAYRKKDGKTTTSTYDKTGVSAKVK